MASSPSGRSRPRAPRPGSPSEYGFSPGAEAWRDDVRPSRPGPLPGAVRNAVGLLAASVALAVAALGVALYEVSSLKPYAPIASSMAVVIVTLVEVGAGVAAVSAARRQRRSARATIGVLLLVGLAAIVVDAAVFFRVGYLVVAVLAWVPVLVALAEVPRDPSAEAVEPSVASDTAPADDGWADSVLKRQPKGR